MSLPISSLISSPLAMTPRPAASGGMPEAAGADFQKMLFHSLSEANQLEHQAEQNIEMRLLWGEITNAEVYTSLRKSELALNMMLQVRNKLVEAYQEIQQMRI